MSPNPNFPFFFDYSSASPIDPRVLVQMLPALEEKFGNNSSQSHLLGWEAHQIVEKARHQVSSLINAHPSEIVWTSGTTESNNLAIKGITQSKAFEGRHVITAETEHRAVLDVFGALEGAGFVVTYLPVKSDGLLDLKKLVGAIKPSTVLVSVMSVNHETGVVQDIQSISRLCQERNIPFHIDASQATGKLLIDVSQTPVSALSLPSQKIFGPKGIGALYLSRHNAFRIKPQLHGGRQEQNIRSGTIPNHQVVGMGAAFQLAALNHSVEVRRIKRLGSNLISGLSLLEGTKINGHLRMRIPHTPNFSFNWVEGRSLIMALKSISISSGSACTSVSFRTPDALQFSADHNHTNSIRFSIGRYTKGEDISYAITAVRSRTKGLRLLSTLWNEVRLDALE
ncbi:cysteine desulfurase [Candidatus Tremblaya phenacola PAVE]|nr:cysteine desulfurase [Candidatus Tremblaya phenacola PAVE]